MTTLGCHNLLDGKGEATPFADILFWTEAAGAVGPTIGTKHKNYVTGRQRDLGISVAHSLGFADVKPHYKRCHWGIPKVTPSRGTFWLTGRIGDERVALVDEHRINAAFAPFKRGEGLFRKTMWEMHTRMTLRIVRKLKRQGYAIYAGGDLNTPRGVSGYRGVLNEVGQGFDRLGSTRRLADAEVLSRMGSDHHRLKATVG